LWRTKKAFLYQGTLKINEIEPALRWDRAKKAVTAAFKERLGLKTSLDSPLATVGNDESKP
jgi:hypothetical protein